MEVVAEVGGRGEALDLIRCARREVLTLVAEGHSNQETADLLRLSRSAADPAGL